MQSKGTGTAHEDLHTRTSHGKKLEEYFTSIFQSRNSSTSHDDAESSSLIVRIIAGSTTSEETYSSSYGSNQKLELLSLDQNIDGISDIDSFDDVEDRPEKPIALGDMEDKDDSNFFLKMSRKNGNVVLSCVICFVAYTIMALLGGTVAFMHFPRTNLSHPHELPDFGYEIIPYWCPEVPSPLPFITTTSNMQSAILVGLYSILLTGVYLRWNRDGKLILQQLMHLNTLVFLTRTTTVSVTGLPQPNPKCTAVQAFPVNYMEALKFVCARGFPPHACGDLIYSGHVSCTLVCMAIMHRHGYMRFLSISIVVWAVAILGIYATLSCRSHYTVDVVLAFYFVFFLREYYFSRSDGVVDGKIAKLIQWLER